MGGIPELLQKIQAWLWLPIGLTLVAGIGYIDYLTGDYSILMFYAIPISLVAWYLGDLGALVVSVASGCARFLSEYNVYVQSSVRNWNSVEDTLFLLIVGLLVSALKRMLDEERKGKR